LLSSEVEALQICGELKQGGFVYVKDENLKHIRFNEKFYNADENGVLPLAFEREQSFENEIIADYNDDTQKKFSIKIDKNDWDIQKIDGVQQQKVTPSDKDMEEIQKEGKDVKNALNTKIDNNGWLKNMLKPVDGRTSGKFGGQRIMNGIKKNPHQGWDIAAPEGTEVKASSDGEVTLADGPYFYSGNMVIINHGKNLSTIYAHLNKVLVKLGDKVKKGDVIGLVGKTGRATGPHLHFGASLNGVRFNPENLIDLNADKCVDF
jgi:murein DD-endopeptidase MepM/ murein hydrolase activator NlpD